MAKFSIQIRFKGGLNAAQQAAFQGAADRWAQVITGDFPRIRIGAEVIEALVIEARGVKIDEGGGAEGNILGQSAPTDFLPNGLPAKGFMEFDTFDLGAMEDDGTLQSVILHEMGHVIGIGTIWEDKNVLAGTGGANPRFTGKKADKEWAKLSHLPANQLPVENRGGDGVSVRRRSFPRRQSQTRKRRAHAHPAGHRGRSRAGFHSRRRQGNRQT